MGLFYRKAPIVEMNVQVRWLPRIHGSVPSNTAAILSFGEDEFFSKFTASAASAGLLHTERVVPAGVPVAPYQPVYRYRTAQDSSVLFQLGHGIFSVNAIQPYKTWEHFAPHVKKGLSLLFSSMTPEERDCPFEAVQVRYLNIFSGAVLQGATPTQFVRDHLKWTMEPPEAVSRNVDVSSVEGLFFRCAFQMSGGVQLVTSIGEVTRNNSPAALLDLLTELKSVEQSQDKVMTAVNKMHSIIHDMFIDLMKPIEDRLEVEG